MQVMNRQQLTDNIAKVRQRVRESAEKCRRRESEILLLAVSKTRPASSLRLAAECGLSDFGENYLQEALDKIDQLQDLDLCWHFIGPIQSNKTRAIAEHFSWVHSVDREKIARRLSEQRPAGLPPLNICLQVNISAEASKAGVSASELPALASAVSELPGICLRGLMAIPEPTADRMRQQAGFRALRELLESLQGQLPDLDTLSMGMSADLEAAITEGATVIRVGTDIFGPRG